ncbi:MAG: hypothetical protein ACJAWO_002506 [Halieaceae bacterium]|jgi:hypothetical protein
MPETEVKPVDLIEQEQMVLVLKDICKVEARFQRRLSLHGKSNSDLVFENYKLVFEAHNLDMDRFKTSYAYYQDSPDVMQQLYDSVIVVLTKEQSELEAKKIEVVKK